MGGVDRRIAARNAGQPPPPDLDDWEIIEQARALLSPPLPRQPCLPNLSTPNSVSLPSIYQTLPPILPVPWRCIEDDRSHLPPPSLTLFRPSM